MDLPRRQLIPCDIQSEVFYISPVILPMKPIDKMMNDPPIFILTPQA